MGLVLGSAPVLAGIDATAVGIALGDMAAGFQASLADVQWVATGYLLGIALVMPVSGWVSERFGARRTWLAAVGLFTLGSVLCGLAWSLPSLLAFRTLQAVGGGLMNPVGQIIVAKAAGPAVIGRLMSLLSAPVTFAPVLGPILGGVLVENAGWRWIFFLNLPICLVALPLAARLVPADGDTRRGDRFDVLGLALLSPGLAAVVYGLTAVDGGGLSPAGTTALAAGAALIGWYVLHALRKKTPPLIDVRLFARRGFAVAAATSFVAGASLYSSMVLLPLYYQQIHHADDLQVGLLLVPQALGAAAGALVAGTQADRRGFRVVVTAGIVLALAGTVPFALGALPGWLLSLALFVRGAGLGAVMGPTMGAAYASVETDQTARAASAVNVLNRIGGSVGTAVLTMVLLGQDTAPEAAYGTTFWWAIALSAVAIVPALLFPRPRR
ncbi:DHA2 family efflux MFS transporter permease subunit [Amycolatopsis suaedae]|uniref:DHA2 family efflux MFS transporter permease subunit n=2 Tax=Amycolatopsis suaedae TaxID=2510978 RepID=A0A4V2ELC2_9PSEU|nr:DHA2 family efflux MFS transporter permease subunit [Amycolatopsis suaedae]